MASEIMFVPSTCVDNMKKSNLSTSFCASVGAVALCGTRVLKHKRRYCRMQGCTRIVKSQRLCQRHGAKPRKCKVEGCSKQSQGSFDGMCKLHFKSLAFKNDQLPTKFPTTAVMEIPTKSLSMSVADVLATAASMKPISLLSTHETVPKVHSVYDHILPASLAWRPDGNICNTMPIITHLQSGFHDGKPAGWHRNEERQSRGMNPIGSLEQDLEEWELELVWMETLVLSGNGDTSFCHLAKAWGQKQGFHLEVVRSICQQQGITRATSTTVDQTMPNRVKQSCNSTHACINDNISRYFDQSAVTAPKFVDDYFNFDTDNLWSTEFEEARVADLQNLLTPEDQQISNVDRLSTWESSLRDIIERDDVSLHFEDEVEE